MKKASLFFTLAALFVSCQPEQGPAESNQSANILCVTTDASGITQTSAVLNGTASIKDAKDSKANAYFYYSASPGDAKTLKTSGQRVSAGTISNAGGDFSYNLSSLLPSTTYYYVASVSIDDSEEPGGVKSFTTEKKTDSFSVTGAAIDISVTSATLTAYANLPADMSGEVIIGIIYSTNSSPSLQNGKLVTSKDLDGNNMYQAEVTDLTPATKYYFKSFLSRNNLNYYGEVKDFTTAEVLASVSTIDAWDISETKAMVGGKLEVSSRGVKSKAASICYGTDGSSVEALKTKGKKISVGTIEDDGTFKAELSGLTASTQFYYVAIALVEGVEFAGSVKSFTTQDKPVALAITGEAAEIGESSAKLYGWCNQEGEAGLSVVYGIEFSKFDLTTAAVTLKATEKDADNKFCCKATGLASNSLYYYRTYVLFNGVRTYGEVKTFTTKDFTATVTTMEASDIAVLDATLNGSLSVESQDELDKEVWFRYSDTASDIESLKTSGIKKTSSLNQDGTFSFDLTNLNYNTTYYYVACSQVHGKGFYGDVKSFTTKSISLSTNAATNIYFTVATLNGKLEVSSLAAYSKTVSFIYGEDDGLSDGKTVSSTLQDDGSFSSKISDLKPETKYYFRSKALVDGKIVLGDMVLLKTKKSNPPSGAVALGTFMTREDGSQYEVYWASCNLSESGFVSSPEVYGDYYAWGETETKADYSWSTYKFGTSTSGPFTKYNTSSSYGTVDKKTVLDPEDDVAHVKLGGKWRMPTDKEWTALRTICTWTWVTNYNGSGINGRLVTATNGNSIFLPAAGNRYEYDTDLYGAGSGGYYWSSSLSTGTPNRAWYVHFNSVGVYRSYYDRCYGYSVRPVSE